MLAHTRADVVELNQIAQARMRDAGELSEDHVLATERGERPVAAGDRLMFLRNERSMGGQEWLTRDRGADRRGGALSVRLDGDQRDVQFDPKDYAHIDHG